MKGGSDHAAPDGELEGKWGWASRRALSLSSEMVLLGGSVPLGILGRERVHGSCTVSEGNHRQNWAPVVRSLESVQLAEIVTAEGHSLRLFLGIGVTVARLTLDQLVQVQILDPQL